MIQASEEIQKLIIEMRNKGYTYSLMLDVVNLAKNTIIKILKEHHVPLLNNKTKKAKKCRYCGKEYIFDKSVNPESTRIFCCSKCSKDYKINKPYSGNKEYIEISDYYKRKGYHRLYIATNIENRKIATIRKPDGETHSMSYAKYLYTSYYCCDVPLGDEVDHINGDKTDDRVENLLVISGAYNKVKDKKRKLLILCKCPVCGCEFLFEYRNLKSHPNPCCSRKCEGIKSHWK